MVLKTQRLQKTRTGLRAVRTSPSAALPPLRATVPAKLRRDTPSETLARSLVAAVSGTGDKIRHRSIQGLRAACEILGHGPVELRDVGRLIVEHSAMLDLEHLREGFVDDTHLWNDVKHTFYKATSTPVTSASPERLGRNLAVIACLLAAPEAERAAALSVDGVPVTWEPVQEVEGADPDPEKLDLSAPELVALLQEPIFLRSVRVDVDGAIDDVHLAVMDGVDMLKAPAPRGTSSGDVWMHQATPHDRLAARHAMEASTKLGQGFWRTHLRRPVTETSAPFTVEGILAEAVEAQRRNLLAVRVGPATYVHMDLARDLVEVAKVACSSDDESKRDRAKKAVRFLLQRMRAADSYRSKAWADADAGFDGDDAGSGEKAA